MVTDKLQDIFSKIQLVKCCGFWFIKTETKIITKSQTFKNQVADVRGDVIVIIHIQILAHIWDFFGEFCYEPFPKLTPNKS